MACLSSSRRTNLIAQLENIDAAIVKAWAAYNAALEVNEVEEYRFDSAEASQKAKMRDPDMLFKQIEKLEKRRESIVAKINGTGVINLNLRRKRYSSYGR